MKKNFSFQMWGKKCVCFREILVIVLDKRIKILLEKLFKKNVWGQVGSLRSHVQIWLAILFLLKADQIW
ncbi:unnamed protein product [Rhizophagus irregularis]|nr:unnamed protein product [Rhizophagus irregularis]